MKHKNSKWILTLSVCLALASCPSFGGSADLADGISTGEHEEITLELIKLATEDPEFGKLLEKSVAEAHKMNPDPDTNPVCDLETY